MVQRLDSNGNVTSTTQYDAYGLLLSGSPPDPSGFGAQAGYYTDHETGLILAGHRYYDPAEGRWITPDPIGYAGGMNAYEYCGDNPVGAVDPSGLREEEDPDWNLVEGASHILSGGPGYWASAALTQKGNDRYNADLAQIGAMDYACKHPVAAEGFKFAAIKTGQMVLDVATVGTVGGVVDLAVDVGASVCKVAEVAEEGGAGATGRARALPSSAGMMTRKPFLGQSYNILNLDNWTWDQNVQWLWKAINRGGEVIQLVTQPTLATNIGSIYQRELLQLFGWGLLPGEWLPGL